MTDENALALLEGYEKPVDLTALRKRAQDLRDTYLKKLDLENQLKHLNHEIQKIERDELPEMFTRAGVTSLTVEATGNHPAFVAERSTVFTAKIPDEKRQEAFEWLEKNEHGDLVKSVINIFFGMQEHEERLRVMKILSDAKVQFYSNESVHHMTLKAFVKGEIQKGHAIPHDLLGVYVFDEVKIK